MTRAPAAFGRPGPSAKPENRIQPGGNHRSGCRSTGAAGVARRLVSGLLATGCVLAAPAYAQAGAASSVQVAPGVVRPGKTADEADMTRRPTGIDAEFVDKASIVGRTQLQASRLALDRSSNPAVKAFARRMVDDHGRIAGALRRLGAQKGVPVQARMLVDPAVSALRIRHGRAFDTGYVELAGPHAHAEMIRLYEAEARGGRDPQLRAFAADTLPMLKAHLTAARQLAQTVATAH
ncbi:DUF4142 domain-containing protein [Burkholderia anthina]|nr:DUF4142 domain-containing protein [Burkholderia anthina]